MDCECFGQNVVYLQTKDVSLLVYRLYRHIALAFLRKTETCLPLIRIHLDVILEETGLIFITTVLCGEDSCLQLEGFELFENLQTFIFSALAKVFDCF